MSFRPGIFEGQNLGLDKGRELGHELGFYAGCAQCWSAHRERGRGRERQIETMGKGEKQHEGSKKTICERESEGSGSERIRIYLVNACINIYMCVHIYAYI